MIDKKARKILFETHWKSGWKNDRSTSPDDFAYAKSQGLMFDDIVVSHDKLVADLIAVRDELDLEAVADAFLVSLSTRRLDLRSALGSYAFAHRFPAHQIAKSPKHSVSSGAEYCEVCGLYEFQAPRREDLNVLSFERHKWGGVRHDQVLYAWFDLSQFKQTGDVSPSKIDYSILIDILTIAADMTPDARPSALAKAISPVVKSNDAERRVLIEILSMCGVLQPTGHSGYLEKFTTPSERTHTGEHYNDWGYPAIWWRGADGVNRSAATNLFSGLRLGD